MALLVLLMLAVHTESATLNASDQQDYRLEALTWPSAGSGRSPTPDLLSDLRIINDYSTANLGSHCVTDRYRTVKVNVDTRRYKSLTNLADSVADVMSVFSTPAQSGVTRPAVLPRQVGHVTGSPIPSALLWVSLRTLQPRLPTLLEARSVRLNVSTGTPVRAVVVRPAPAAPSLAEPTPPEITEVTDAAALADLEQQPWFLGDRYAEFVPGHHMRRDPEVLERGIWTFPYFCCSRRRWLLSYTVRVPASLAPRDHTQRSIFISFDVDVTQLDINQCDVTAGTGTDDVTGDDSDGLHHLKAFRGSHRCHETTTCTFTPGRGWVRGSYVCQCKPGHYTRGGSPVFDGMNVEVAYDERQARSGTTYDRLYVCRRCQPGCDSCTSDRPCLANYNWVFRIVLLSISMLCVLMTFIVIGLIMRYKRLKVMKSGSPMFLTVTLLGCVAMYMEMAAIFPVLDVYSCVATKWTRHMGFCITFSALLLKTWRVSLTYRVKSAHKLKLTDKQLVQWLFPILLIMIIYLSSWTISDPPVAVAVRDAAGLQFWQCEFGWWDHSIAAGELLFLLWGIMVCVNVRNAETLFDEAKYISWAVYNIGIVNIAMATVHLFITSGPDVKYLLGFVRTQLSTTTTIVLILAPKFYRIAIGLGDELDARAQARGAAASFYLNGIEPDEEDISIYRENEELKEEVQKLAAQIEFMKIVHMEANNRHLKPRRDGYFSQNSTASRRKSSIGTALRLDVYTSLGADGLVQTGNDV